jgi:hypothetical protein
MVKAGRVVSDAISGQCVKTDPICEIAARPPSRRIQMAGWRHGSMIRAAGTRISGMFGDPNWRSSMAKPVPTALIGGERRRLRACAVLLPRSHIPDLGTQQCYRFSIDRHMRAKRLVGRLVHRTSLALLAKGLKSGAGPFLAQVKLQPARLGCSSSESAGLYRIMGSIEFRMGDAVPAETLDTQGMVLSRSPSVAGGDCGRRRSPL